MRVLVLYLKHGKHEAENIDGKEKKMSAFMVDREHIRYLVSAMKSRGVTIHGDFSYYWRGKRRVVKDQEDLSRIGNVLWSANLKSIHARYPDTIAKPGNIPGPIGETFIYAHLQVDGTNPMQVLKAISCLRYQSCEFKGWELSEAAAVLRSLEQAAIRALPGFDGLQWSITEDKYTAAGK